MKIKDPKFHDYFMHSNQLTNTIFYKHSLRMSMSNSSLIVTGKKEERIAELERI